MRLRQRKEIQILLFQACIVVKQLFIAQIGTKHRPHGPWWTGKLWSGNKENRAVYEDYAIAEEEAVEAAKSAVREVALFDGWMVIFRCRPPARSAYIAANQMPS